jgi:hypothetical protein
MKFRCQQVNKAKGRFDKLMPRDGGSLKAGGLRSGLKICSNTDKYAVKETEMKKDYRGNLKRKESVACKQKGEATDTEQNAEPE